MRAILLLAFLALSACARPVPTPMPLPDKGELLQGLIRSADTYRSLDGEAKVAVSVEGKFFSSQQFLLVEKPDRFRTDVLSTFGQLVLQLAVDRGDLNVFLNTTVPGHFYRGAASDENLVRFTRVPVHFKDMVRLFLYDPPLIQGQGSEVKPHEEGVQLILTGSGQRQSLIFDRQLRLIESSYYRQGQLWLKTVYNDFSEQDGFPKRIKLEVPDRKTEVSVRFSELETNVTIPEEKFVLNPPANATLESLPH